MKRFNTTSIVLTAMLVVVLSSCGKDESFVVVNSGQQTHTIFNITVAKNTKTKTKSTTKSESETKANADSRTSYDTEKKHAYIDANTAFGLVGFDNETNNVLVDDIAVFENNGVRSANLVTSILSSGSMNVSAFYPHVNNVNYHKDGSYAVSFTPNDIEKGALASSVVDMRCDQGYETVNLRFHHITNSIGFKVCDISADEQLKGLMHVRKVVLHGMPTEGMFVVNGNDSHWVPNAKRKEIVYYEGDDLVRCGEENADFLTANSLSDKNDDCNRHYLVPEELTEGKHYVEVIFDVDPFDYDGTHYSGAKGKSQIIPLSGVVPDDVLEFGLQYTFVLGMNIHTVYRPIEFTAAVGDWELKFNGRILDYDNE